MSYINIVAGAFIDYQNARWRYELRQDHATEWRNTRSFEHLLLTDRQIQTLLRKGELKLHDGVGRVPVEGKTSRIHGQRGPTSADWEEAGRRLLFVMAIHQAGLFRPGATVDDWDAVIMLTFRAEGMGWTKLRGENKGGPVCCPSYKSVRRWVIAGGEKPKLEKLLPAHRYKGHYEDRLHVELRKFITERVNRDYLQQPAITIDALKTIIHTELEELNKHRAAAGQKSFDPPGFKAIQSSIDAFPGDEVLRRRYGEMAAFLEYGSAEAQEDPKAPLDRVELDATPCDLFVVDLDTGLAIGRPTLVVAIDRCTRMVLGWFVTFEKPSVHALMQCLRNAILDKDYLDQVKAEQGWDIRNACETFGVPRTLRIDRARENIADHVARFAVRAGINRVEITAGKKPWLKGAVERVIRTISERLFHPTRGTTLHNALMRMGYQSERDAVCTPADLDYALHKYFIDVYPFEKRRSLNNRQPIKLWRELTRKYPVDSIGSIENVAHLFGRTEFATPGRHGINYENLQFFSAELLEKQRPSQFRAALADHAGKIEFHVDPADLGRIHVRLPHLDGKVIEVPVASKWSRYATGLSLWHHRRIREFAAEEACSDADALLQAKYDLMQIMKGTALAKRGGLRARSITARMEGILRTARAGNDAATTVPGSEAHSRPTKSSTPVLIPTGEIPSNTAAPSTETSVSDGPFTETAADDGRLDALVIHNGTDLNPTMRGCEADGQAAPSRRRKGYRP